MIRKLVCNLCLSLLFLPSVVQAHSRSESFSEWSWQGSLISYSFSVLEREATRIPTAKNSDASLSETLERHLDDHIVVSVAGKRCSVQQAATALPSRGGYLRAEGGFVCPEGAAPEIKLGVFFSHVPTHTHYAKLRSASDLVNGSAQVSEFLFTHARQTQLLKNDSYENLSSWQAFHEYVWIGSEHIVGGIDHLAFVMALLLLVAGLKEIALLVTGFTLGHSLSLAVAVLGFAEPNNVMVEALIGFTIVLVVVEARAEKLKLLSKMALWLPLLCLVLLLPLWAMHKPLLLLGVLGVGVFSFCYFHLLARSQSTSFLRILVTIMFGMIHGFGFAGGLLGAGFPAEKVALVLLGFNVGVELGQLLVLTTVLCFLALSRRWLSSRILTGLNNMAAMLLSGLGVFWFVSRLLA